MDLRKFFTLRTLQDWLSVLALFWFLIFAHLFSDTPLYSMAQLWTILLIVAALVGLYCLFKPLFQKINSSKTWIRAWQLCGLVLLVCMSLLAVIMGGFWLREQILMWLAT